MMLIAGMLLSALNVRACDAPDDDGSVVALKWECPGGYDSLQIWRLLEPETTFTRVESALPDAASFQDAGLTPGCRYRYRLVAWVDDSVAASATSAPVVPRVQFFNVGRLNILICIIIVFAIIIGYIIRARHQGKLFIRRIPALNAIDEAIGRATEMGKPVLYVPGIMDIDEPETIASMSILGRVAEKTAEYGTPLYVPSCHAMAMSMAQQVVKESATRIGRPDWYNADNIRYLTDDQFGYVSAVDGIMVREKPATNFYLGKFYAESLILAETGHATGAIQIAGTALPDQLPFFVAACDYTLLGEELYAASAYLSQEPVQLGSLKGQDLGKLLLMALIALGTIAQLFGWAWFLGWFEVGT